MHKLFKSVHLLALSLWSGAIVFFAFVVALPTIQAMRQLAQTPGNWLALHTEQQGTRLAGEFLDVVFARYFPFQGVCGAAALLTGCFLLTLSSRLARVRLGLIVLAFLGVNLNYWVLAPWVHDLRQQRYSQDKVLADAAQSTFALVHNWSLAVDLLGLACVIVALILFACHAGPSASHSPSRACT
jgi:hypothetical protein